MYSPSQGNVSDQKQTNKATFFCEVCDREAGPAMIGCPERQVGACPYIFHQTRPKRSRSDIAGWCSIIVLFWLISFSICLLLLHLGDLSTLLSSLIASVIVGLSFHFVARQEKVALLLNPKTGIVWRRSDLLGITNYIQIVTAIDSLQIDISLPRPLTYPPSIGALYRKHHTQDKEEAAIYIAAATVIVLLAQNVLTLSHTRGYRSGFRGRWLTTVADGSRYPIRLGLEAHHAKSHWRDLEERIIASVRAWSQYDSAVYDPFKASIYDLIFSLYNTYNDDPTKALKQWVQDTAIEHSLGRYERHLIFRQSFKFYPGLTALEQDSETVHEVYNQFGDHYPDLMMLLTQQISAGLEARTYRG